MFAENDPYTGIDLDNCVMGWGTSAKSEFRPGAASIVQRLDTYAEVSPSGTGLKLLVRGTLPPGERRDDARGIEMYDESRFFTITGAGWPSLPPRAIADRQAELEALHAELFPPKPKPARRASAPVAVPLDDLELIHIATNEKNDAKAAALLAGDISAYDSHSSADVAFCGLFTFYIGDDPARLDRLFRGSGLMRDKWDAKHYSNGDTYGTRTIR